LIEYGLSQYYRLPVLPGTWYRYLVQVVSKNGSFKYCHEEQKSCRSGTPAGITNCIDSDILEHRRFGANTRICREHVK
jgi:hypothetical protein